MDVEHKIKSLERRYDKLLDGIQPLLHRPIDEFSAEEAAQFEHYSVESASIREKLLSAYRQRDKHLSNEVASSDDEGDKDRYGIWGERFPYQPVGFDGIDDDGLPIFKNMPWSTECLSFEEKRCLAFLSEYGITEFPYSITMSIDSIADHRVRERVKVVAALAGIIYGIKKWQSRHPKTTFDVAGLIQAACAYGRVTKELEAMGWFGGEDAEVYCQQGKQSARPRRLGVAKRVAKAKAAHREWLRVYDEARKVGLPPGKALIRVKSTFELKSTRQIAKVIKKRRENNLMN
jgi:hypothetical protein